MKLRTAKLIIKEGILNAYRNKLMSLASISIVMASLIILGLFLLLSMNLNFNIGVIKQQPEIEVFCLPELDDDGIKVIEDKISGNDKVQQYEKLTKQEAYEKAKDMLGKDSGILEGYDESFLPVSFIIKLKNPSDSAQVVDDLRSITGVDDVTFSQQVIDFITKVTDWTRIISIALMTILLVISVFIISNTIKLTVFARRKEINIMKYIGATDWFIRWPFIIEGLIIGSIGALMAYMLIYFGYNAIEAKFNNGLMEMGFSFIEFVEIYDIRTQLMGAFTIIGAGVGAMGSVISIRKYLRV